MATRTSPQILIVEDEGLIRVFLSDVLEDGGFKTRQAATADEALELLQVGEFAAAPDACVTRGRDRFSLRAVGYFVDSFV